MDLPPRSWTSTLVCRPSAPTSPRSRSGLGSGCARRGRTGFALTEKGAIIYREAKRLFATLDEFGVMAATVRGRLTGTLRLGFVDCTVTNPNSPISRAIGRFNNRDHEVTIEVSVGPPAELQRGVLDGSLILRWPAFLPRSPNWSPSRFMAKSINSTVAPATACSTARQSASTISPAAGSSRAATGAASTCRAIGRRTACGFGRHHGSRGNPYSVGRVFGLSPGALCLALGRCGQVALHPSRKTELCGRLLQHKSLRAVGSSAGAAIHGGSEDELRPAFLPTWHAQRKSDGRDKTQPLRDGS